MTRLTKATKLPRIILKGCKRENCGGSLGLDRDDITQTWEYKCLNCGRNPAKLKTLPRLGGSDKRRAGI